MTKILFVSDIHLNLRKNKEWEYNRFMMLADFLIQSHADILVLGGDIFDKANPTLDEIAAFYEFINKLQKFKKIYVISGNHEDLSHKETTFHKIPIVGFEYFDFTEEPIKLEKYHLYFVSHHRIKEISKLYPKDKSVIFSHIRASVGMIKEEIPVKKFMKKFDYAFLGDIHIPLQFYNVHYCGSPYTIHFEPKRSTGIFCITIVGDKLNWRNIDTSHLPQKILLETTLDEYDKLLKTLSPLNLYKIRVNSFSDSIPNLTAPKNVQIEVVQKFDEETTKEQTLKLQKEGQIDVFTTLLELLKLNDATEEQLEKAQNLLLEIKKN